MQGRKGVPYHPKELGYTGDDEVIIRSGLLGVLIMFVSVVSSLLVLVLATPLVLFGVMEYVGATVTNWRVRWVRRDGDGADG